MINNNINRTSIKLYMHTNTHAYTHTRDHIHSFDDEEEARNKKNNNAKRHTQLILFLRMNESITAMRWMAI